MYSKEEAKEKLAGLIADFNSNPRKDKLTEEETREFITEMFKILGWNFKTGEVSQEESIKSKGYVDYGFRLNGVPVMFVEAKKTSVDIQNEGVEQAIDYAWHKATTWAVLTNFKRIRVFNAYLRSDRLASQLIDLEISKYLDEFDRIWLLSKESFEAKTIDQMAEKFGKKAKETPVEKRLFEDLNNWRELLAKEIKKGYSSKYSAEEIDEMIQLLLDRLILIRKIEDEGLESKKLEEIHRAWASQSKKDLWKYLRELFFELNDIYNSKIFSHHELDNLEIGDYPLKQILPALYKSEDNTIRYNFSFIDADILGNIYEQYLGYLLKTTAKRASGETSKAKRKEQGIYYTPRYIVDYIVKNTLGEKLKECKTIEDVEKIKVLDPACGSGSFLIRAFDEINQWYEEKGLNKEKHALTDGGFETIKDKIIKRNLFGVDLDPKAVELAQLNLLIRTADKKHKLPMLQENIKCGNSLIDDEKIAGDRAFKWEREFKQTMDNDGFDVVIGNPPYIRTDELDSKTRDYLTKNYKTPYGKFDIYFTFIEKGLNLLKDGGYFGFIVPNRFLVGDTGVNLRNFILQNCLIEKIVDVSEIKVFKDANVHPIIIILKKEKNKQKQLINKSISLFDIFSEMDLVQRKYATTEIPQKTFYDVGNLILNRIATEDIPLIESLISNKSLGEIMEISEGLHTGKDEELIVKEENIPQGKINNFVSVIRGSNLKRYLLSKTAEYINLNQIKSSGREKRMLNEDKLVLMELAPTVTATIDTQKNICLGSVYFLTIRRDYINLNIKYLLALLNSKLLDYFYKKLFASTHWGSSLKYRSAYLEKLPIKIITAAEQKQFIILVDKMLSLNKRLNELGDKKTDERARIEAEIKRTDAEIDELVYKLYGITGEERKMIEESLK